MSEEDLIKIDTRLTHLIAELKSKEVLEGDYGKTTDNEVPQSDLRKEP